MEGRHGAHEIHGEAISETGRPRSGVSTLATSPCEVMDDSRDKRDDDTVWSHIGGSVAIHVWTEDTRPKSQLRNTC